MTAPAPELTGPVFTIKTSNEFNAGWLAYILGLPRDDAHPHRLAGWVYAGRAGVFDDTRQGLDGLPRLRAPQFAITIVANEPGCTCEPEHVWPCALLPRCDEPGCEREVSTGDSRTCGRHYRMSTETPR